MQEQNQRFKSWIGRFLVKLLYLIIAIITTFENIYRSSRGVSHSLYELKHVKGL